MGGAVMSGRKPPVWVPTDAGSSAYTGGVGGVVVVDGVVGVDAGGGEEAGGVGGGQGAGEGQGLLADGDGGARQDDLADAGGDGAGDDG